MSLFKNLALRPKARARVLNPSKRLVHWAVRSAVVIAACVNVWALDPGLPPGSNFDLSHWKLTLPIDNTGSNVGGAITLSAGAVSAGFANQYFYTGPDGAMLFWCPADGAVTSGTAYPRSELREVVVPSNDSINWIGYGAHVLDAQCKVTTQPATKKVVIGQIHSYSGNAYPLVKLQFNNGAVEALVKQSPNSNTDTKYTFSNVGLGNLITYQIKVVNGLLTITVNGLARGTNIFVTDPAWADQSLYFKAGNYCQDNIGNSTNGAQVSFYQVVARHGPTILTQPVSQTVLSGGSATFSINATGNVPVIYRWQLNGTNLPNATAPSLTIASSQAAHAGDYTVVVTDAFGVATSAPARLTVTPANVPAPYLTARGESGEAKLRFVGPSGGWILQVSSNLVDWVKQTDLDNSSGAADYSETEGQEGNRFFRAVKPASP